MGNKSLATRLFVILGIILTLPFYYDDSVAGFTMRLYGSMWTAFGAELGLVVYPLYVGGFVLPIFLIISAIIHVLKKEHPTNKIFLKFFYGFIISSIAFILIALVAISQFKFTL